MMLPFKRKLRNRRFAREHVLDVKLRSSQLRAARARMAAVALGIVFVTVLGIYGAMRAGDLALNQFVYENKAFEITSIDVQTDGTIALDQIQRWAGVKAGENLLALDLARVRRDLELVPAVQSASVERILPHTLRICVIEREPIAQFTFPRPKPGGGVEFALYHVDPEGCVMVPLDPRQRTLSPGATAEPLPGLVGIGSADVQAGRRIQTPQMRAAIELILAFAHSPMAGLADLQRIDLSAPDVLTVTTGQGSEVIFGLQNIEQQLRRWRQIYDVGQASNRAIATLDLAITNNVPARWLEASVAPAPPAKAPKTLRNRKKNV